MHWGGGRNEMSKLGLDESIQKFHVWLLRPISRSSVSHQTKCIVCEDMENSEGKFKLRLSLLLRLKLHIHKLSRDASEWYVLTLFFGWLCNFFSICLSNDDVRLNIIAIIRVRPLFLTSFLRRWRRREILSWTKRALTRLVGANVWWWIGQWLRPWW